MLRACDDRQIKYNSFVFPPPPDSDAIIALQVKPSKRSLPAPPSSIKAPIYYTLPCSLLIAPPPPLPATVSAH